MTSAKPPTPPSTATNAGPSGLKLLSMSSPKTIKSLLYNYATFILYLAPSTESGYNTCPKASAECAADCLFRAGRGAMKKIQRVRIAKTRRYFEDRVGFLQDLEADVNKIEAWCKKHNLFPAIRLNGTSDIRWERHGIIQKYPAVQFYDYMKLTNRKGVPANYRLTFSFDGHNIAACREALANGMNVAVPFIKRPAKWLGYPTVDGDEDDLRFMSLSPCVIALKAKGPLRKNPNSLFLGDNHNG